MIVILCGCSTKSIFPSCAHPLAGSRLVPTLSLGRGSYPCRHRFLACRDKVQVFGVNSAIYIISVVSAGCASAIVMCGRRCPLNGRIVLSVVRSRFLSLVNLRIQPCKPLRIRLANLSSCSLAVIVFYCLDMGLDYIFPPYPMSRAIWQWLTFTFNMAVVDLHLHHAAANLALTVVALVRYGPRHVSSKKRDHTVNMRSLQTRHCTLKAAAIVVL